MSEAARPAEALLIVGCGLIGASIARAARARGAAKRIIGLDTHPAVAARAQELDIVDEAVTVMDDVPATPDMVAVCTPPGVVGATVAGIWEALEPDAVIFDTASVKNPVVSELYDLMTDAEGPHFVPAHPIAGTEQSGPEAGRGDLFIDRWCILTPNADDMASEPVRRVSAFWEALGAKVATMEAYEHDRLLAATSHVPHLVAYALTATASPFDLEEDGGVDENMVRYSAGGFRDFTRIAASDPVMWRDVFALNRFAVLEALSVFERRLKDLRRMVNHGKLDGLEARFRATRAVRDAIVEAGQETAAPDFGRRTDENS